MNRPPRTEETAVHAAFRKYESSLKRFISRFLPKVQDIEDVAQETFLRAYVTEQGRAIEQPKSFLFRIAKNVALNQLALKSNQIIDHLEDLGLADVLSSEVTLEDELVARQTLGLHCEAVAALRPHPYALALRKNLIPGSAAAFASAVIYLFGVLSRTRTLRIRSGVRQAI